MGTYRIGNINVTPDKKGLQVFSKGCHPIYFGCFSEIQTTGYTSWLNLNGNIKYIRNHHKNRPPLLFFGGAAYPLSSNESKFKPFTALLFNIFLNIWFESIDCSTLPGLGRLPILKEDQAKFKRPIVHFLIGIWA